MKIFIGSLIASIVVFLWRYGRVAFNLDVSLAKTVALNLEKANADLKVEKEKNYKLKHEIEHLENTIRDFKMLKGLKEMEKSMESVNNRLNKLLNS